MSSHANYKQKWLAALEAHRTEPTNLAANAKTRAEGVSTTNTDVVLSLKKISSGLGEAASAAQSLVSEMDSHRAIAGLHFSETSAEIDLKLTKMPADVAIRRLRDVLRIAEARIAMLHIHADDLHIANNVLTEGIARADKTRSNVERALIDTVWVGPHATDRDVEDFRDAAAGTYARDGIFYEDEPHDFEMTKLFEKTSLRTVKAHNIGMTDDETSDDSEDEMPNVNRLAQVVPTSPIQKRKIDL